MTRLRKKRVEAKPMKGDKFNVGDWVRFDIPELIRQGSESFVEAEKPLGKKYKIKSVSTSMVTFDYTGGRNGNFNTSYLRKINPLIIIEDSDEHQT